MRRVRVRIEELVLRGVAPGDRRAVAEALRRELARTLAGPEAGAALAGLGRQERLRPPRAALRSSAPSELGRAAGETLAAALVPGRRGR